MCGNKKGEFAEWCWKLEGWTRTCQMEASRNYYQTPRPWSRFCVLGSCNENVVRHDIIEKREQGATTWPIELQNNWSNIFQYAQQRQQWKWLLRLKVGVNNNLKSYLFRALRLVSATHLCSAKHCHGNGQPTRWTKGSSLRRNTFCRTSKGLAFYVLHKPQQRLAPPL